MSSDQRRREAFEKLRDETQKRTGGRVSSETVHKEIARIARENDRKEDSKKGGS